MILDKEVSVTHDPRYLDEGDIVVLGGCGEVGQVVSRTLAQWYSGRVVLAGHNLGRAQELANSMCGPRPMRVDVDSEDEVQRVVERASVVVMCVERGNERVASASLAHGAHYIDISASASVLAAIERRQPLASGRGATAVLSVGLAPGLTNLLAKQAVQAMPDARHIDISILAGLGEHYGPDAVRWTVNQLSAARWQDLTSAEPSHAHLPDFGRRTVYPLAFSNQYTLQTTLGVHVTTRLCFDSAALTAAIFATRSSGALSLARRLGLDGLLTGGFTRIHLGSNRFVVHVRASGGEGNDVVFATTGRYASRVTGVVTAHVARALLDGKPPAGVLHIEQLIQPADMFAQLIEDETLEFRHHRLF